jgi:pyruvate kinase
MIANINRAARTLQRDVKIFMDLEGPKIRTAPIKTIIPEGLAEEGKKPSILLWQGDRLSIVRDHATNGDSQIKQQISLTSPQVLDYVKPGERVYFDDGKMYGVICTAAKDKIVVEILQAPAEGLKLKEEKGINFPDSHLMLPAMANADLENLDFIVKHADMVGFSFVQTTDDIVLLQQHLRTRGREDLGIILKIETNLAFNNLPSLQLAAMRSPHCGIMIARGDLAVEIGFLRLAEVQEEILWLADAAHMPVIWATQVLESQVKKGAATRAEVSDVVKSVRSECVMLNKGKHLVGAIKMIKDIDKRMAAHEEKKRKKLRAMAVAKNFFR